MSNLPKLPKVLTDLDQWIFWKLETKPSGLTKIPCDRRAVDRSVKKKSSWLSYEEVLGFFGGTIPQDPVENGLPCGFGFCFTEEDDVFGVDIDACLPNLRGEALEILSRFDTYAEVSPSKNGVKLVGIGSKGDNTRCATIAVEGFKKLEVYDRERFFTITGNLFGLEEEVKPQQEELEWLLARWLPLEKTRVTSQAPSPIEGTSSLLERANGFEGSDEELIEFLREEPKYDRLWLGDKSDYANAEYPEGDWSAADAGLMEKIAWLAGPVPERILRIFSASALADRDKWRDRDDYQITTLNKVLSDKIDFYSGSGHTTVLHAVDFPDVEGEETPLQSTSGAVPDLSFPIPETGIIRDVVDLAGPLTESPDSTLALGTLIMLSAVAGWGRVSKWGESEEPCVLYACICGPSASGRKTTGLRTVENIFHEAISKDDLQLESVGHVSGRKLLEIAIGDIDIFYVKLKEPKVPQTVELEDGTIIQAEEWREYDELKAARKHKLDFPPAVVLIWDEMAKLLNVEGDWQRDTRAELLRMYNGHHSGIRTSGKEGLNVPGGKAQMAFLGTMVTADLERGLNSAQANDGLMGRILFSPDSRDEKPYHAFPPSPGIDYERRKYEIKNKLDRFRERCETVQSVFPQGWDNIPGTHWTPEAVECRERWYRERKQSTGVALMLFDRVQATAAKIACLLALAEDSEVIDLRHVEMAQQMADTSIQVSVNAVETAVEAQRDRYLDALCDRVSELGGTMPISKLWEYGLLGVKEQGEKMPERSLRELWISKDPRLVIEEAPKGGGHRVRLES